MEEKKLYNAVRKTITLADGREIMIETGKLAKQADGSVVVKMGDTMLLGTVVAAKDAKPDTDFMPLQVEYKEKYAACGRYPGGFMKREGKANDSEILVARLIDRALRPLFPSDYHAEVYVTVNLISADKDIQPDALAGLAASAALAVSDIPFGGPISEVRVARIGGQYVINPAFSQMQDADLDIMVGGTIDNILMVEGEMKEVSEEVMLGAIKFAHEEIKKHCAVQIELSKELGKDVKRTYCHEVNDEELRQTIIRELYDKAYAIATSGTMKHEREDAFNALEAEFAARFSEEELVEKAPLIHKYFHDDVQKKAMRNMILDEGKRLDGRRTDEIRPIWCEVGYLPAAHGSAIFTRGETQSLTTVTLGTKMDEKVKDEVLVQGTEQFVLHYNFPPFSTGEAKAARGLSRREIGHGHLAWRALKPMVPVGEENPYAVRVVSDILESNGSSSMATVCAGTLALMDAGVKLKKPVSGIAMGLISDSATGRWAVLSDILGDEDHLGDMDFKVTGTKDGITATQMDIKVDGLSYEVLAKALEQARVGRMHILGKLTECIAEPRADYRPFVPRIVQITIPQDMIGAVIGPGGKVIQDIQKTTGTTITITETDNKGVVDIFGLDKEAMDAALSRIKSIVAQPEVGDVYNGKVRSIMPFGAFVEIMPGKDALLHISEIDYKRFETMEETGLKEGDEIDVKLIGVWTRRSSGGGGGSSKPTVDIPDDVPTGLNGDDHFAYIVGYPNGNVEPNGNITRAEVATIFFRLLTEEVRTANSTQSNSLSDVTRGQWFNHAVSTLSSMGIVKGHNDGTFAPNAPITRAEFAAIAARFDDKNTDTSSKFTDIASHWAKNEIGIAANKGWINGYPDDTFRPNQYITRAEAMTLVNRVLNRLPENSSDLLDSMIKWPDNSDASAWYYLAVQEATNSHAYSDKSKDDKYEKWTTIRETRDWTELEK
jgi:polyribonucleotide nucleotidyltransferase